MPKKQKTSFLTKPLTRKRFKKELAAATRKQFKPLQKELASQNRASKFQSQRLSNYFKNYQQTIGRGRADVQAAYDQAGQTMGNYAAMAGSQNAALQQQLSSNAAQNASLYGGQGASNANLAAQGEASRVRYGADVAGAIQGQGANTYGYLTAEKANAKLGRIEALRAEAAKRALISKDKMDLLREKGDFRQEYITNAREGERRYELALKELRNSNRQAAKDRAFQASESAKDRKNSRWTDTHGQPTGGDGSKKESKKERKDAIAALKSAPLDFQQIFSKNSKSQSIGIIAEYLRNEANVNAALARKLAKQYVAQKYTQNAVGGAIGGVGGAAGGHHGGKK